MQTLDIPTDHTAKMPFQRHFQFKSDIQQQPEALEVEKELRIVVLNTLSQVVEDTIKRISGDYESN